MVREPAPAALPVDRALQPLLVLHAIRRMGLVFLVPAWWAARSPRLRDRRRDGDLAGGRSPSPTLVGEGEQAGREIAVGGAGRERGREGAAHHGGHQEHEAHVPEGVGSRSGGAPLPRPRGQARAHVPPGQQRPATRLSSTCRPKICCGFMPCPLPRPHAPRWTAATLLQTHCHQGDRHRREEPGEAAAEHAVASQPPAAAIARRATAERSGHSESARALRGEVEREAGAEEAVAGPDDAQIARPGREHLRGRW